MSAVERAGRSRADDAQRSGTASALSKESSSLSPASRVLAIADQVADEDEQMANGDVDSEGADSEDSIGPGSRCRGTIIRGYVQERRGRHKKSSIRHAAEGDSPRSPTESQASSSESWRRALSSDGKGSPRSMTAKQDHDHGTDRAAVEEEGLFQGASEMAGMDPGVTAAVVDTMNVTGLKAKAAELGIPTGGRKSQLKARIKQKLSASSRSSTSSTIAGPNVIGCDSDKDAGSDAISGPGSATATVCWYPNATAAVSSDRPSFADGGNGDGNGQSVPEQQPTNLEVSALPEESGIHGLRPSECSATTTVEKDQGLADKAANPDVSSSPPRLPSEQARGLVAAAPAGAAPAEVAEPAASPMHPREPGASVSVVDAKDWKRGVYALHDPASERAEAEVFQGGDKDKDEDGGGVGIEQLREEGGIEAGAENDERLFQKWTPGGSAKLESSAREQSRGVEKEEVRGVEVGEHPTPERGRMDTQAGPEEDEEGQPAGRFSGDDVEASAVLAAAKAAAEAAARAAADGSTCTGAEVVPAVLFSPGSDVALAAEQRIEEGGVTGAEEGEREGHGGEESFAVPSAEDLNEKFTRVARLWAPVLRKPALKGDRADPGVLSGTLPETEAFKAKIKVLSAWFHQGARTIAPTAVASAGSNRPVHGDNRPVRTAAGVGQARHTAFAGSKARRWGGAKGKAAGVGQRTGADSPARKVAGRGVGAGVGAGADGGGSISTAKAGGHAVPKVRSRRGSSGVSTPGGAGMKGRPGKPRAAQRLSVSPPRTKLSAAAAAAARVSAASSSAAALAADARAAGRAALPEGRRVAKASPTPAASAAAHSSLSRRNPLIRDSSPPRSSRASSSAVATPARIARLRSRKTSLVCGGGVSKATSTQECDAGAVPAGDARTPSSKCDRPADVGATGSGSRSALQVFGFDPAVSASPHAREVP